MDSDGLLKPKEFLDLKAQYTALCGSIIARVHRVLDRGQDIMDPDGRELDEMLSAYGRNRSAAAIRRKP